MRCVESNRNSGQSLFGWFIEHGQHPWVAVRGTRLVMMVVLTMFFATAAVGYDEKPVGLSDEQVAQIVAGAPDGPAALIDDLGLAGRLKLVDYIDCTAAGELHPMMDQGTSRVIDGPAGRYRITAEHRHAFVSYRWKAGTKDKAHVLVFEYPDDGEREICFFTHESELTGARNADWSLETGVYTGNPYPNTGKMQYHTMFYWPSDDWPVAIVANFNRSGMPAAVSRIWVYEVEGGLPAMEDPAPSGDESRMIGSLYDWSLVAVQGVFGLTGRESAFRNMAEYYAYTGQNMVGWPVVSNNNWGFKCQIPAWGKGDQFDELGGALRACDERGVKFVATFELGRNFKVGGISYSAATRDEYREKLLEGFKQFFERYGQHESLYAIGFGMPDFGFPYGNATMDMVKEMFDGGIEEFCGIIKRYQPGIKIYTFIGAEDLHRQYFSDAWGVVERWEKTGESWPGHLAVEVNDLWVKWGRDPQEFLNIEGLEVAHQYQPDDHAIYDEYSQQGRPMIYFDVDTSKAKSQIMDTSAAMIWNSFFEAWFGLYEGNFWYQKLWVAPDFNAGQPYGMSSYARVMAHRDRDFVIAGAWNNKPGGHEAYLRKFAGAYRALPPVDLTEVTPGGTTPLVVRAGIYEGDGYISMVNNTAFEQSMTLVVNNEQQTVEIGAFEIEAMRFEGVDDGWAVAGFGHASQGYVDWLRGRLIEYEGLVTEVRELNVAAAGAAYTAAAERARRLFEAGQYAVMDTELGFGLTAELQLRKEILTPPQIMVPKIEGKVSGRSLDDWPEGAADILISGSEYLGSHIYFPNSWTGEEDLSAGLRLAHDGEKLYVGVKVYDSKVKAKDLVSLYFSTENYLKWEGQDQPYELSYEAGAKPLGEGDAIEHGDGYTAVFVLPLSEIDPQDRGKAGFVLQVSDADEEGNIYPKAKWARKQVLIYPHQVHFAYYSDARTCGELVFE